VCAREQAGPQISVNLPYAVMGKNNFWLQTDGWSNVICFSFSLSINRMPQNRRGGKDESDMNEADRKTNASIRPHVDAPACSRLSGLRRRALAGTIG